MSSEKRAARASDELQMWGRRVAARLGRHRKRIDIHSELERLDIALARDHPYVARICEEITAREAGGYAYEGSDASFELLARRLMGQVPRYFSVVGYEVGERGEAVRHLGPALCKASLSVIIAGESKPIHSRALGVCPVDALARALSQDLGVYASHVRDIDLVDYKVRLLTRGTEPLMRVEVETRDHQTGEHWFTTGVAPEIVDAAFEALLDAINYKLFKSNVEVAEALAS